MIELNPKDNRRLRMIGAMVSATMLLSWMMGPYPASGASGIAVYGVALAIVAVYLATDLLVFRRGDENVREKRAWRDFVLLTLSMAYSAWELFSGGRFPAYPLVLHAASLVPLLVFFEVRADLYEDPASVEDERDRLIRMIAERAGYTTMLCVAFLSPVVFELGFAPSTEIGRLGDWFEYYFIFCVTVGMWVEHYVSVSRYLKDRPELWDSGWNVFGHVEMLYSMLFPARRERE